MPILITIGIIAKNEAKYITTTLETLIEQTFRKCDAFENHRFSMCQIEDLTTFSNLSEIKDLRCPNAKRLGSQKSEIFEDFDHSSYEIIVIDGNSDDKTREIADKVISSSNIKYKILNEKDFGFYGHCFSRNLIIDHSSETSKYIAYTDADCIVDKNWLKNLYESIEGTADDIAGAGGPGLIAPTNNRKELIINHFLTSIVASGGNPAFSQRNVKYLKSIPNYNAIYKKDIISKFRYDDSLIISDDTELNLRLGLAGYKFIYVREAKVYHRETDSIIQFSKNMIRYGVNIANAIKKLKLFKIKVFLTILFLFYMILFIPLYLIWGWMVLIPLTLYIVYTVLVFAEILFKTKSIYSLLVFLLVPVQHLLYAYGVIYNFLFIRPVHKNNKHVVKY